MKSRRVEPTHVETEGMAIHGDRSWLCTPEAAVELRTGSARKAIGSLPTMRH